jgi:polyhydroxyalkanoate synthase
LRPLLVDWGAPGEIERSFTLTDYIAGRLDQAFDMAQELSGAAGIPGERVHILGYCMGGLLALALADRRRRRVASLALLATPWDFHAARAAEARLLGALAEPLAAGLAGLGEVPVELLQSLFFAADPQLGLQKFSRFGQLNPASDRAEQFVAIEDWLNDGVPMALPTARECLGNWYGANLTAAAQWRIAGKAVDPTRLEVPALVVLPEQDRIVPPPSAIALADLLPRAHRLSPSLGHVGMVVGDRAATEVWQPLARWFNEY